MYWAPPPCPRSGQPSRGLEVRKGDVPSLGTWLSPCSSLDLVSSSSVSSSSFSWPREAPRGAEGGLDAGGGHDGSWQPPLWRSEQMAGSATRVTLLVAVPRALSPGVPASLFWSPQSAQSPLRSTVRSATGLLMGNLRALLFPSPLPRPLGVRTLA